VKPWMRWGSLCAMQLMSCSPLTGFESTYLKHLEYPMQFDEFYSDGGFMEWACRGSARPFPSSVWLRRNSGEFVSCSGGFASHPPALAGGVLLVGCSGDRELLYMRDGRAFVRADERAQFRCAQERRGSSSRSFCSASSPVTSTGLCSGSESEDGGLRRSLSTTPTALSGWPVFAE